jgi:glycosyltransferase involved in cell wall biosynthesis
MTPPRVHYLSRRFYPDLYGGIEVSGWELVKHWHAAGVPVTVTAENYPDGRYEVSEVLPGVRCTRIRTGGRGRLWRVAPLARVGRWASQLLVAHPGAAAVAAHPECVIASKLARPRRPVVYRLISVSAVSAPAGDRPPATQRAVERLAARLADVLVVESGHVRDQAVGALGVPAQKLAVVPTGVNLAKFAAAAPAPELDAVAPAGEFRMICVGRLHYEKGVDFALEAFARMKRRGHARLILAGDGPERKALEAQASRLGLADRVAFLGRVPDPERYLAGCQAVVLPSRYESYGNALVEGMAAGLPGLGRDTDPPRVRVACPEIIAHGQTGFVVDPHDPADLARRLDELCDDPQLRKRMGAAGQRRAHERYGLDVMAERYLDLVRGLVC